MSQQQNKTQPSSTADHYEVSRSDLPLHCPMPGMSLWNAHPQVYLPIEEQNGEARCPYCGTLYILKY